MKRQILKGVACIALLGMLCSNASAELQASNGIDGYRSSGVSASGGSDMADILGLSPDKILDMGGDVSGKALSQGVDLLGNIGGGDRWLQEFYSADLKRDFSSLSKGDQMKSALSEAKEAKDTFIKNAVETTIRAELARAGVNPLDDWIIPYEVPVDALAASLAVQGDYNSTTKTLVSSADTAKNAWQAIEDFDHMKKDFDMGDANDLSGLGNSLMKDAQEEVSRVLSLDAMRFMNGEALSDMADISDQITGAGVPTMDILNIIVGMYNLDSVYGMFDQNAGGGPNADQIAKALGVQVAEFKSCTTSGQTAKECCTAVVGGIPSGSAVAKGAVSYKTCCKAMTGNETCTPMAVQQDKDCLMKQENIASDWTMCDVKCKGTDFGDLIHKKMEDGKTTWDESLIDDLLEECGVGESDWAPSPTVLTSAELAAIVPETIKSGLIRKD